MSIRYYYNLHPKYNSRPSKEMAVNGIYKVAVEFNKDTQEWEIFLTECE